MRYASAPAATLASADPRDRERLKEAGAAALVAGAVLSFAVASALGVSPIRAFLAMGWTAAWALARLLIMRLVDPGSSKAERRRVDDAWGPALLPYLAAVVFPLDILALALSAWLTHRGLTALGMPRARAVRAVAWSFGGQLAVEVVAWMGRAGMLAFASL